MEAPKKIYIVNDDVNIKREWYKTKQVGFETTEYTRTDAFIERACEWLKEQYEMVGVSFKEDFIERFKEDMKGE